MKTILAHLKKDAITCRFLLWAWAACVAFDCLMFLDRVPYIHAAIVQSGSATWMGIAASFVVGVGSFTGLQLLLLVLLIVRVIHIDSLMDPDAFWRTRPIARRELLVEKVLFITLLIAGALLSAWAVRLDFGVGGLMLGANLLLGVAVFASVTTSLSKLVLNGVGFILAGNFLGSILVALQRSYAPFLNSGFSLAPANGHGGFPAENHGMAALYAAGFILVIVHQYLTLKTNVSRGLLFAVILGTYILERM